MMKPFSVLMITTALTVPLASTAFAQTADTACGDLEQILVDGLPENISGDEDRVREIVEGQDGEACLVEVTRVRTESEAETASDSETATDSDSATAEASDEAELAETARTTVRLEDEVTIEGMVFLDRTPPQVELQGGQTDVEIQPGRPSVSVTEGQAEIVVRQAPAQITVDMPTPTIRIEQAPPEIIITMGDPNVSVGEARPQVQVRQSKPTITVTQAPPRVELELRRAEDGAEGGIGLTDRASGTEYSAGAEVDQIESQDAQVNMTEVEPRVTLLDSNEEPQVEISKTQLTIRFEQSEQQVQFASQGEPTIEFVQTGEPTVTFNQASAEGGSEASQMADTSASGDQAATGDQAAATGETAEEQAEATEEANEEQAEATETDSTMEQNAEEAAAEVEENTEEAAAEVEENTEEAAAEVEENAEEAEAEMTEEANEADTEMTDTANNAETATTETTGPMIERDGYQTLQAGEFEFEVLDGADVYGVNDEDVGEIGELLLDDSGQVTSVVIEVGGFLGLGEKDVEIPFNRLSVLRAEDGDVRVYVDATEEELESLPEYQD